MTDWARGYPIGELYPPAWYSFQSPAHLRAVCALMGVAWSARPEEGLRIAEVGCGTGYTANVLAAGNPDGSLFGLDYNPAAIGEARELAAAAGLGNVTFLEVDLAELDEATLSNLPEFDLVMVHGVWSWVADGVRDGILRLIRKRLKTGGVALLTYNALPGSAGGLGLSRLVRQTIREQGDGAAAIAGAGELVQRLIAAEAANLHPSGWRRILTGATTSRSKAYLVHEFSTDHWRPSFFADVADAMATARCEFVGSATLDENFPALTLSPAQLELWQEARDTKARQLLLDLCVPRSFRRDVYVRGLRPVPREVAVDALWLASASRLVGDAVLRTQAGEAKLPDALVHAANAALAQGPMQVGALRALPGCDRVRPEELLAVLVGAGCALPLWRRPVEGPASSDEIAPARRLNTVAADRFAPHGVGEGQMALATPALGGGLAASPLELAVARICAEAGGAPMAAQDVAARLLPRGKHPEAAILTELEQLIATLIRDKGPVWRSLDVI